MVSNLIRFLEAVPLPVTNVDKYLRIYLHFDPRDNSSVVKEYSSTLRHCDLTSEGK